MPYSIAIGPLQVVSKDAFIVRQCTCSEAQKGCMPSFVFSVAGQVAFRSSLDHLSACNKQTCISLRKKVKEGMSNKLKWLFQEEVLLGCVQLQPYLYGAKRAADMQTQQKFKIVANHLSQCPHESCARLRRSLLLSIRERVSPNTKDR